MSTLGGKFSANVKTFIEAVFKWSLSATPFWLLFDSFGDSFEIHHRRVGVFVRVAWDSCTVNVKVLHTKYTCDDLIRIHFKFSSKTCVNSVILWIFCMILSVKKKKRDFWRYTFSHWTTTIRCCIIGYHGDVRKIEGIMNSTGYVLIVKQCFNTTIAVFLKPWGLNWRGCKRVQNQKNGKETCVSIGSASSVFRALIRKSVISRALE